MLREPLETGRVLISRAMRTARFPARFQLVAAMNPCPCGWRGHPARACACTPDQVALRGPRLRPLAGPHRPASALAAGGPGRPGRAAGEASPAARAGPGSPWAAIGTSDKPNAAWPARSWTVIARWTSGRELRRHARRLRGSARVLHRTLRVARTIADLEGAEYGWAPGMSRRRCSTGAE